MKIKTYMLLLAVMFFFTTAGTKKSSIKEGDQLGDRAPEIELTGVGSNISFVNNSSRYTLLHFWAAYDGNSRKQNILLWNYLKMKNSPHIKMLSVSMDSPKSVFEGTIKTDGLNSTNQMNEWQGKDSEAYRKFGLKKGFRNFLIDDKGVIIATNVTPEILDRIVN